MVIDDNQEKESSMGKPGCTDVDEALSCEEIREIASKSGSDDPTDGRKRYDWKTRYPKRARIEIVAESLYLFLLLTFALIVLFLTWNNWLGTFLSLSDDQAPIFKLYMYYSMSGLLGGVLFDFKNLYKSIARGWWHQDRRIWRIISPFVAMVVGFVVGAMIECSMINASSPVTSPGTISIGFLSGYFADRAIGKMREVAAVFFGESTALKSDGKK